MNAIFKTTAIHNKDSRTRESMSKNLEDAICEYFAACREQFYLDKPGGPYLQPKLEILYHDSYRPFKDEPPQHTLRLHFTHTCINAKIESIRTALIQ